MRRLHWILISLLAAVSVAAVVNWCVADDLRRKNDELGAQCQALQSQLDAAGAKQNSASAAGLEQPKKNSEELLRLRSEVTRLRNEAAEAAKPPVDNLLSSPAFLAAVAALENEPGNSRNVPAPPDHLRDSWAFSGYATPEATLMSAIWAMHKEIPRAYLDSLSPDEAARQTKLWGDKSETDIAAKHQQDVREYHGIHDRGRRRIFRQMKCN